jgi:DNA-binding NarL/FixJ family response regulator
MRDGHARVDGDGPGRERQHRVEIELRNFRVICRKLGEAEQQVGQRLLVGGRCAAKGGAAAQDDVHEPIFAQAGGVLLTEVQRPATRIVVADDHPAMLAAVAGILELQGFQVVASVADGRAAVAAITAEQPDVALLDIRMPHLTGIEVARAVPGTPVVLYTGFGDRALLAEAFNADVRGFVLKEAPVHDLVRAIERVTGGGTYVDPVLAGAIVGAAAESDLPALTARERDVLALLADGLSNEAVGVQLGISAETVRTHLRKAMAKLDADTRTQAVATALRQALIS